MGCAVSLNNPAMPAREGIKNAKHLADTLPHMRILLDPAALPGRRGAPSGDSSGTRSLVRTGWQAGRQELPKPPVGPGLGLAGEWREGLPGVCQPEPRTLQWRLSQPESAFW